VIFAEEELTVFGFLRGKHEKNLRTTDLDAEQWFVACNEEPSKRNKQSSYTNKNELISVISAFVIHSV